MVPGRIYSFPAVCGPIRVFSLEAEPIPSQHSFFCSNLLLAAPVLPLRFSVRLGRFSGLFIPTLPSVLCIFFLLASYAVASVRLNRRISLYNSVLSRNRPHALPAQLLPPQQSVSALSAAFSFFFRVFGYVIDDSSGPNVPKYCSSALYTIFLFYSSSVPPPVITLLQQVAPDGCANPARLSIAEPPPSPSVRLSSPRLWGLGFPPRHYRRRVMANAVCVLCSTHQFRRRCSSFSFSVLRRNDFRIYLKFFSVASVLRFATLRFVSVHLSHGFYFVLVFRLYTFRTVLILFWCLYYAGTSSTFRYHFSPDSLACVLRRHVGVPVVVSVFVWLFLQIFPRALMK